jgi:hypothetical protein
MTESRTIRPEDEAELVGIEEENQFTDRDNVEADLRAMNHKTEERGTWMQVYPAHKFFPNSIYLEDIHLESIVWALPHLCRYGGHCNRFYSVMQHSILIARYLESIGQSDEVCIKGLYHDGSEGYLVDMPRPIKPLIPEYYTIEHKIQEPMFMKLGLSAEIPAIVKSADSLILYDEGISLFDHPIEDWPYHWKPGIGLPIPGEEPFEEQRKQFRDLHTRYTGERL